MKKAVLVPSLLLAIILCSFVPDLIEDKPVYIPPSPQRIGDAAKGYTYLVTGDYVRGGIPYNAFLFAQGPAANNFLQRSGLNSNLSHEYTAVTAPNGEVLVAPNCLQCHAQVFDGKLVIGLGNSLADFTRNERLDVANLELLEKILSLNAPKQYEAAAPFIRTSKAITPYLYAHTRGVNIADRLAALLVAHRDPLTFRWTDSLQLSIPDEVIPTDTPPWWLLKKKNAMFYNGFGRGDFGRFLMASNLLTVNDTSESRLVNEHMPDVLAYIYSLTPPKYPKPVDEALASKGKMVFESNCASCHGSYGEKPAYPNLLIPESIIGTDSLLYKSNYSNPQFVNWFNKSWFTMGPNPARLEPFTGYIAPPLDGIWVTAPYLHNGSVPTIEALLNSKLRPQYWSRDFDQPSYDYQKLGWKFSVENKAGGASVYNTTLPGYGNYGHYFGDALSEAERKAVIEYLKTL
ncbi:MAG TPA: c-type cytochrome [Flavisolibacter sp.]|nr:c-type cytochrome [Flavisolibacter sp.]